MAPATCVSGVCKPFALLSVLVNRPPSASTRDIGPHTSTTETRHIAMKNTAAARLQHERRPPLREVVRADGRFPYRPNIVSGLHLHYPNRDQACSSCVGFSCSGLPQAREEIRGPDRAEGDGRASSLDDQCSTLSMCEVGVGSSRLESGFSLRTFA